MKISVILAVENGISYTKQCLYALRQCLIGEFHEIIVIDHGSTDGSYEWLLMQPDIRLLTGGAVGTAGAWNLGAAKAEGDTLLFLQNHVVLSTHAAERMKEALWRREDIGAAAPYTNSCHVLRQRISGLSYRRMEAVEEVARQVEEKFPPDEPQLLLDDCCLMMKRRAFDDGGCFRGDYTNPCHEVVDLGLRLLRKGYFLILTNAYVHCEANGIAGEMESFRRSTGIFYGKWKFYPGYSMNIRNEFFTYMDPPGDEFSALDVGCSCGGNLMWLKYRYPRARLCGIELNGSAAEVAGAFGRVKAGDVEKLSLEEWKGAFDYILMGDVLEHLLDPWRLLGIMAGCLKPEGKAVICIPNIGHISILHGLLNGMWQYEDQGILDRTHLRFFTRKTFEEALKEAGLRCVHRDRTVSPDVPETWAPLVDALCGLEGAGVTREELLAFQWIFVVQKNFA